MTLLEPDDNMDTSSVSLSEPDDTMCATIANFPSRKKAKNLVNVHAQSYKMNVKHRYSIGGGAEHLDTFGYKCFTYIMSNNHYFFFQHNTALGNRGKKNNNHIISYRNIVDDQTVS